MSDAASPPSPPRDLDVLREEPLARHTYMRLGGPAEFFATPANLDELTRLVGWARAAGLRVRVLGGGSNVLVADAGVRGLVLSLRRACGDVRFADASAVVGGAVMLPALARAAAERGLGGLEFAIGIPGSVGGALQSNAGTGDGRDIGARVEAVTVLDAGEIHVFTHDELEFGYRTSRLQGSGLTVIEATLRLEPRPRAEIEAEMHRLLEARGASQPTAERNAGSIFRNPPGDYAGRLIEEAGCKGLEVGGARVSTLHANFIVHEGAASALDVATLMAEVQRRVRARFNIALRPEVEWWGEGDPPSAFR